MILEIEGKFNHNFYMCTKQRKASIIIKKNLLFLRFNCDLFKLMLNLLNKKSQSLLSKKKQAKAKISYTSKTYLA